MTPDRLDELAEIATELVIRVRDDEPAANGRWLESVLPDPADWFQLCFMLACAVPDDRPWSHLTAWITADKKLKPHGTHAAAERHRYHGERLCDACLEAERARDRDRKRTARRAA